MGPLFKRPQFVVGNIRKVIHRASGFPPNSSFNVKLSGSHVGISAVLQLIPGFPLIVIHLFISLAAPLRDAKHLSTYMDTKDQFSFQLRNGLKNLI